MKNDMCKVCNKPCIKSTKCFANKVNNMKIQTLKNMINSLENSKDLLVATNTFLNLCREEKVSQHKDKLSRLKIKYEEIKQIHEIFLAEEFRPCRQEFSDISKIAAKVNFLNYEIKSIMDSLKYNK